MKDMFFISRNLNGPYKFLISSSKFHLEKEYRKKFSYEIYKKISFNYRCIFFLIRNILNFNFFSKKDIMLIKYKNYNISRYAIAEVFKNYYSYLNPLTYLIECIKNFYNCALTIESLELLKKKRIIGAFVDHPMYTNGLILEFLSKKKIPIYSLGYPKGIFAIQSKEKKKLKYEEITELKKSKSLSKKNINQAKKSINKVIHKTELIPWMRSIKFQALNYSNLDKVSHVIYAHAFTDAQLVYGYDGFRNVLEWLEFTVSYLLKNKKNKILIKAHPSFFHSKFPSKQNLFDKKLFNRLYDKYRNNDHVIIFKHPIKNYELLKRLKKNTILISHHGSAILEGLHLGFKCIASTKTFWNKNLKLTNQWENKKEYVSKLNCNWRKLKFCKKKDLYDVCFQLFCDQYSLYGKKYWQQIISEELNINRKFLYENSATIFNNLNNF